MCYLKHLTTLSVAAASVLVLAAGADGAAVPVATLTPSTPPTSFPNFRWLASSGGTVVAAGWVADLFTESSNGWASGPPTAVLSDPSVAAPLASGLSISGETIVEGLSGQTSPWSEDVFVRPSGGWSGAVGPSARLVGPDGESLTGGVISGQVVADGVRLPDGVAGPRVVQSVNVFTEPATGWSGTIAPVARLAVPAALNDGEGLANSGGTIFVGSGHYVYVFTRPATGWSGTVSPSARLRMPEAPAPISASALNVLAFASVFVQPNGGWSGTVQPVGDLYAAAASGPLSGAAFDGHTAVLSSVQLSQYGCSCSAEVNVFSKPRGGWSGTELSTPAISTVSGTGVLPVALQEPDLFLTGGGTVDVYQLAGSYGIKPGPPSVFGGRLTGLRVGRPRLRFTIATKPGYPTVQTFTVRLPRGLAFTRKRGQLKSGVSVTSAKPVLFEHKGTLSVQSLPFLDRLTVTVNPRRM